MLNLKKGYINVLFQSFRIYDFHIDDARFHFPPIVALGEKGLYDADEFVVNKQKS